MHLFQCQYCLQMVVHDVGLALIYTLTTFSQQMANFSQHCASCTVCVCECECECTRNVRELASTATEMGPNFATANISWVSFPDVTLLNPVIRATERLALY